NGAIAGGTRLQPLLYALALEAGWDLPVGGGRLLYCSREGEKTVVETALTEETRQLALGVLRTVDHAIEHGQLLAAPSPGACRFCDFRPICGPREEERIQGKPLGELR